ncbi:MULTISPECIES: efflux RND transporter periplasmic adaptor subunit [unclassified Lentimonas]|uniref:efflux RND transporter periplasmic adaptor subunit n=1 Tax=unclassified Lentimonas TaxID=2630993 RepID=UPI0013232515|nr:MULTISPECIES: efflux RND transporter periplasmic adaptor subunit [unclassified Lentimonas]CAA6676710.1 Macrolide-specific efflux protein MacA [Lentimonas sp. CC4]CAA6684625.1 Macrolide-specific efflux protein MacA [Lentimonas sp. CC6]CAA7075261.1 Macrolide-specific efflux protein MacA [Lentimonas sp. CC4]CAA7170646.1 Macrolide-specific efflux protein MacA [Lentimonas sp. CC21]CAA7182331.1 Macrolide-specific efflux protein MacA [Lentimonas sp. CC8]
METSQNPLEPDLAEAIQAGNSQHKSKKFIYLCILCVLLGAGFWLYRSMQTSPGDARPQLTTQPIQRGDIRLTITATGNLEPTNEVSVGSELSGTTLEVYVDSNDRVVKGQQLARLDTSTLENQLKASRAALESTKAKVVEAEATRKEAAATLARQKELHRVSEGRIPSNAELATSEAAAERAKSAVLSAQAAVVEAEAQIEINESDLAKGIIRSPTDGVVLSRSIEPGQTVASSFTTPELFVIAEDLTSMKLEVAVAEADIGGVAAQQSASFSVDAWPDRSYQATVLKVSYGSEVTDNVVTYETELSVTNKDLSLRPGMTATADIAVAHHEDVLLVPVAALRFNPTRPDAPAASSSEKKSFLDSLLPGPPRRSGAKKGGPSLDADQSPVSAIWILKDGRPERVEVKLGISDGRYTEVSADGLDEGTEVILSESTQKS